jgi:hypothetical protein
MTERWEISSMRPIWILSLSLSLCCLIAGGCKARVPQPMKSPAVPLPPDQVAMKADKKADAGKVDDKGGAKKDDKKKEQPAQNGGKVKSGVEATAWRSEVKGWGAYDPAAHNGDKDTAENEAQAAAEKHALANARQAINKFLRGQNPPFVWEVPQDYNIRQFLANDKTEPQRCKNDDNQVDGKEMHCWSWAIAMTPQQLQTLRTEDSRLRIQKAVDARSVVARERMLELSRIVGWAVLALLGTFAYIRLDDWTRGAQRRWLRVAVASLVGVGSVGWWLLS